MREAYDVLCRSRRDKILAACDLYRMHLFFAREQERKNLESKNSQPGLLSRLLPSRGILRAMFALCIVATVQIVPRAVIEYMKLNLNLGFTGILLIVAIALFVGIRPISLPVLDLIGRRQLVLGAMIVTPLIIFLECMGRRFDDWIVVMLAHLLLLVPVGVQVLLPVVYAAEVFPLESRGEFTPSSLADCRGIDGILCRCRDGHWRLHAIRKQYGRSLDHCPFQRPDGQE